MSIIDSLVEVKIAEEQDFLKIKETLTRIGVASVKQKKLWQSCHILHKQGRYYIVHFKELFVLDGKTSNLSEEDLGRRNTIIRLLQEWGLVQVLDASKIKEPTISLNMLKVLPFKEKAEWELIAKYNIGKKAIKSGS